MVRAGYLEGQPEADPYLWLAVCRIYQLEPDRWDRFGICTIKLQREPGVAAVPSNAGCDWKTSCPEPGQR